MKEIFICPLSPICKRKDEGKGYTVSCPATKQLVICNKGEVEIKRDEKKEM